MAEEVGVTPENGRGPGMGWLTVDAVQNRGYSVVQASVILMATGFVLVNLVVDVLYAVFDPRIRYS